LQLGEGASQKQRGIATCVHVTKRGHEQAR
jgi:hypothetical protein